MRSKRMIGVLVCLLFLFSGCARQGQIPADSGTASLLPEAPPTQDVQSQVEKASALLDQGSYSECISLLAGLEGDAQAAELLDKAYQAIPVAPVSKDGKGWQYIDGQGNVIIDLPACEDAKPFSGGKAIVKIDGKYSFIDKRGNVTGPLPLECAGIGSFSRGLACFSVQDPYSEVSPYKFGVMDAAGNVVMEPIFTLPVLFYGDMARVTFDRSLLYPGEDSSTVSMHMDRQGNIFDFEITAGNAFLWMDRSELILQEMGGGQFNFNNRVGYMDSGAGRFVWTRSSGGSDPKWLEETRYVFTSVNHDVAINKVYEKAYAFVGGLAPVKELEQKWGFIDTQGNYVIQPQYDDATRFSQGLAAVNAGGQWGYIDPSGAYAIQPRFSDARIFSEGLAAVCADGKWGFIDKTGSFVIEPAYAGAETFVNGVAPVQNGEGLWGLIDKQGKVVKAPQYNDYADIEGYMKYVDRNAVISNEGVQKYYYWSGNNMICGFRNDDGLLFTKTWKDVTGFSTRGEAGVCVSYDNDKYATGKWGVINKKGEYVVQPSLTSDEVTMRVLGYDYSHLPDSGTAEARDLGRITMLLASGQELNLADFVTGLGVAEEGYALFIEGGKYGFKNADGSVAIPAEYAKASGFGH